MATSEDLEAVAHLVGATNAQLKSLDQQIVSTSTNLQASRDNWDPTAVIASAAKDLQLVQSESAPAPIPPEVQATPPPPSTPVQGYAQPLPTMSSDSLAVLLRIEQKLDLYMERIQRIETIGASIDKSIQRGLKSKVKQITIKLDDSNNTK